MPNPQPQEAPRALARNRATLLLIAAIFVMPIGVAWLYAAGVFGLNDRGHLNHGELISPPLALTDLPASTALAPLLKLPAADWAALYVARGNCDAACVKGLRELAVIRTLVGKEGTRVSVFGVVAAAPESPTADLPRIIVSAAAAGELSKALQDRAAFIGFVDARGLLMMHFAPDAASADIKEDLQRLLRASAIR